MNALTLMAIFDAGRAAGSDATGVYAVWMAGHGKPVVELREGQPRYTGQPGATTPPPIGPMPTGGECVVPYELYHRTFKEGLAQGLSDALQRVFEAGQEAEQ